VKINEKDVRFPPDIDKVNKLLGEGGDAAPRDNKGAAPMTSQLRHLMNVWNPDNDGMTKAIQLFIQSEGELLREESSDLLKLNEDAEELADPEGTRAHEWTTQEDFDNSLQMALETLQKWVEKPEKQSLQGAAEALQTLEEKLWDGDAATMANGETVLQKKKEVDDLLLALNGKPLINGQNGINWVTDLMMRRVKLEKEKDETAGLVRSALKKSKHAQQTMVDAMRHAQQQQQPAAAPEAAPAAAPAPAPEAAPEAAAPTALPAAAPEAAPAAASEAAAPAPAPEAPAPEAPAPEAPAPEAPAPEAPATQD